MIRKIVFAGMALFAVESGRAWAQEFKMPVQVTCTANKQVKWVTFGFDPNASDSMTDAQWGEQMPPPFILPGDLDARMTNLKLGRSYLTDNDNNGGPIDIRRKPSADSFRLEFELTTNVAEGQIGDVTLTWDYSGIAPAIKHIYLKGEESSDSVRLDMLKDYRFKISWRDSGSIYSTMLISLIYSNPSAVDDPAKTSNELTIFPNPMQSQSKLHFTLHEESHATISVYDITGKKVFGRVVAAQAGENIAGLDKNDFASPGVYLVRITGNSFEKTATLIVQ